MGMSPRGDNSSFGVGNVYGFAPCSCGHECRYSKLPVATVCAPDDISVTCSTLKAECDCGFLANENRARGPWRRPESFMHVASALQLARAPRCLGAVPRILAWHKENCATPSLSSYVRYDPRCNSIATTHAATRVAAATVRGSPEELRPRSSVSCLPYTGGV